MKELSHLFIKNNITTGKVYIMVQRDEWGYYVTVKQVLKALQKIERIIGRKEIIYYMEDERFKYVLKTATERHPSESIRLHEYGNFISSPSTIQQRRIITKKEKFQRLFITG